MCIFVFFFSSRRRHTRCLSDWSSDVCSSDLQSQTDHVQGEQQDRRRRRPIAWLNDALGGGVDRAVPQGVEQRRRQPERSEERRVGKECRARWWQDQGRKSRRDDESEGSKERN